MPDRVELKGDEELLARIELALASTKRIGREARDNAQRLAQIRDEIKRRLEQ